MANSNFNIGDVESQINTLSDQIASFPEIIAVAYTLTSDIVVPANGMKELGPCADVLGNAARRVLNGYVVANGFENIIFGMNRYGSTIYAVVRNVGTSSKTIPSGTSVYIISYKE